MLLCYPPGGRPCPQVGPSMACKLLGRVGVDYLRDPHAECPLGQWAAVTGDAPIMTSVGASDGGEVLPVKAPPPCGGCAKTGLAKIAHGATGLAKAVICQEQASEERLRELREICRSATSLDASSVAYAGVW